MPDELWQDSIQRENFFSVADPFERYELVNSQHKMKSQRIVDLHFQSTKTATPILESYLDEELSASADKGVWVICGTAHHVVQQSHQKKAADGHGILYNFVKDYLDSCQYRYKVGKNGRNHECGAMFVY